MRKGHGKLLSYYDIGPTPFFAYQGDRRFSYCLYVPEDYDESGAQRYPLIVLVHGTERGAANYRTQFMKFAEDHDCIIMAPLFPANMFGLGDLDNYKMIEREGVRFDRILLGMVDEIAKKYRLAGNRFLLHGFSGGGHFAHRFFYLHPRRLRAVSIGAPGLVTLLDETKPWWLGVADLEARFGVTLDYEGMKAVPVLMVVGAQDTETWEITLDRSSDRWMEGANAAGVTRIERLASLRDSFEKAGIKVRFEIVAGARHVGAQLLDAVRAFMKGVLHQGPQG